MHNMTQNGRNFIDNLYILIKWRKQVIITFLIVCTTAAIISLVMPKVHRGVTTIMPPMSDDGSLGLSSLISQLPLGGLGFGNVSNETYSVLAILNSRNLMESVVEEFNLLDRYNVDNEEKAIEKLRQRTKVDVDDEGTIRIKADASTKWFPSKASEDSARIVARDMANFIVSELDRLNKELKVERARNTREFVEKRYYQNISDLKIAEDSLNQFQKEYDAIALPEQTKATIMAAAELQAEIMTREIEMNVIASTVSKTNSEYKKLKNELNGLQTRLNEMYHEKDDALFFALDDVPDLSLQYARLFREVMIQEKIMEFLLPQYEQAKIQEAKDTPTIQVLDRAVIPVKRVKPKRAFFVLFWGAMSLLVCIGIIFGIEYINKVKQTEPDKYTKIVDASKTLYNDFRWLRRK